MELNSKSFKEKCEIILSKSQNLHATMFIAGFTVERRNDKNDCFLLGVINNPIKDQLRSMWDETTLAKLRRGSEYTTPTEEEEVDPFPLSGILFVMRQLQKAIELHHPDWGMFYIIGEALGRYNSSEISQVEFEYFLSQLPVSFIEKYQNEIVELCNYFDEKDKQLNLYIAKEKVVAYFSAR